VFLVSGHMYVVDTQDSEDYITYFKRSTVKLNNFPKFKRPAKVDLRNFFLAISGVVNRHFFNN
jgi:hypothetical protein